MQKKPLASNECLASDPIWYNALAPSGSAARYIASLSPDVLWVGIFRRKGRAFVPGPYLGKKRGRMEPCRRLSENVCGGTGARLGKIEVELDPESRNSSDLLASIKRIARELGELWPA